MKTIINYDMSGCKGCLCLTQSEESRETLSSFCHGNPKLKRPDSQEFVTCPCAECLLKCMCENQCDKFDFYRKLNQGILTTPEYLEKIK